MILYTDAETRTIGSSEIVNISRPYRLNLLREYLTAKRSECVESVCMEKVGLVGCRHYFSFSDRIRADLTGLCELGCTIGTML